MSTNLGMAKIYFKKEDFGKMLKLKDTQNLYIGDVRKDYGNSDVEIEIITTMDNVTNNRTKNIFNDDIRISYNSKISSGKNYYLSFDISREGVNYGVLLEENSNSELKIIRFVKIAENKLDDVVDKLIESIKGIDNCKIIIPTINIGQAVVDCLKEKGFTDIIELDLDDMRYIAINNIKLIKDKDKLFKLIPDNISSDDMIEFIKTSRELDNTYVDVLCDGRLKFKSKSMEITSTRICAIFYALSKLGYKL